MALLKCFRLWFSLGSNRPFPAEIVASMGKSPVAQRALEAVSEEASCAKVMAVSDVFGGSQGTYSICLGAFGVNVQGRFLLRSCLCHPRTSRVLQQRHLGSLCFTVQGITTSLGNQPFSRGKIGKLWEGSSLYKDMSFQHPISLALLVAYCQPSFPCKFSEDMLPFGVPPSVGPSHL